MKKLLQGGALKILYDNFERYLSDESNIKSSNIESVYIPDNDMEISELLAKETPLTVFAGGTGIAAGATANEGSVISMEKFQFLQIEPELCEVSVGAGVTLRDLNIALARHGLWYPADSTEQSATIGGNAATCAWGTRSYKYGSIRNYINAVHVIIPGAGNIRIARDENIAAGYLFSGKIRSGGKLISISDNNRAGVKLADTVAGFPKKNSAGYYMKKDMDIIDLLIGSEGTLGIITMLELTVQKIPHDITAFMGYFNGAEEAFDFIEKVKSIKGEYMPCSIEFMDSESLKILKKDSFNVKEAGAAVFLEIENPGVEDPDGVVEFAAELFNTSDIGEEDVIVSSTKDKKDYIYSIREGLPNVVNKRVRAAGMKKLSTDFSVNNGREGELLEIYNEMRGRAGIKSVLFGHAGDNNLHLNFIPCSAEEYVKARGIYEDACRKVGAMGGTIAAEHGVGKLKKGMLKYMYDPEILSAMGAVRKKFDPGYLLNRGSVI
jgi:D-lactate dehydrogenase (cytochrome)